MFDSLFNILMPGRRDAIRSRKQLEIAEQDYELSERNVKIAKYFFLAVVVIWVLKHL